ncbi:MAG: NADH-quinone oxidoreductase subunit F [Spirochaetia bacterium]
MNKKITITQFAGLKDPNNIKEYEKSGGWVGLKNALKQTPQSVIDTVKKSGLRGRGGAGFPTGIKWESLGPDNPKYLVCNADEGEPGTFKDRFIMERCPFLLIEGMVIAAYAAGINKGYIYIRGEYPEVTAGMLKALDTARKAGYLGENIGDTNLDFDIEIKVGGGSYVVGDETALLSSLMGNRGYPLLKPPYPTQQGLWNKPTIINNVETLSYAPVILAEGADEFAKVGPSTSPGPKLFCVSGHVENPGVYEFPMGTKLSDILSAAGGMKGTYKAVQIGGTAGVILDERALDYHLDYDSMKEAGASLGSGALVFMNSATGMTHVLEVVARFFSEESCGQCFPCRYGTRQLELMAENIASGMGKLEYLPLIQDTVNTMYGGSFCPFGQSVTLPVSSVLKYFGDEIVSSIKQHQYLREVI